MESTQRARKEEPFFQLTSTGDNFEDALRNAVRTNASSMNELHASISKCMSSLRSDGMECEAALLTMKAFIRELGIKHKRAGSEEFFQTEMLMDQIVRWCISDYYAEPSSA
jgi:hypothetical protein